MTVDLVTIANEWISAIASKSVIKIDGNELGTLVTSVNSACFEPLDEYLWIGTVKVDGVHVDDQLLFEMVVRSVRNRYYRIKCG